MATVSVTAESPELLDRLTDLLGQEPDISLRRPALGQLDVTVEDAPEFILKMRVQAKLGKVDGTKSARLA